VNVNKLKTARSVVIDDIVRAIRVQRGRLVELQLSENTHTLVLHATKTGNVSLETSLEFLELISYARIVVTGENTPAFKAITI
jgi:hypothetical protein